MELSPETTNVIWKFVDWHVGRYIYLRKNGFMYVNNGKLVKSKITRLKPEIMKRRRDEM